MEAHRYLAQDRIQHLLRDSKGAYPRFQKRKQYTVDSKSSRHDRYSKLKLSLWKVDELPSYSVTQILHISPRSLNPRAPSLRTRESCLSPSDKLSKRQWKSPAYSEEIVIIPEAY